MGAIAAVRDRIGGWWRQSAAIREFERIGPEGRDELARDLALPLRTLDRLVGRGARPRLNLRRLMRALGLDLDRIARTAPGIARDLEVTCSECRATGRCTRDLNSGQAPFAHAEYCPNATTLSALLSESSDIGKGEASRPGRPRTPAETFPMVRRVEQQARLMEAMMARVGVDPGLAARDAGGTGYAAASHRCLTCLNSELCEEWLKNEPGTNPPSFCPNAEYFERTRRADP